MIDERNVIFPIMWKGLYLLSESKFFFFVKIQTLLYYR